MSRVEILANELLKIEKPSLVGVEIGVWKGRLVSQ
jgi:hypothetical protein